MMLAHLIYRDEYRLSRTDVTFRDVVDLIYIVYGTLNIDVGILIASFHDAPEAVAFINSDLDISPYGRSFCIAGTDHSVSGKDDYHNADNYEQEEPERFYYSIMMSCILFHIVHHFHLSIKEMNFCSVCLNYKHLFVLCQYFSEQKF